MARSPTVRMVSDDTVRFLLGDRPVALRDVDPQLTVLRWLREEAARPGTKEGCAEGDCGACTVVLGERQGRGMRYRAVNACILFVPALDGKQLLTVEDLKTAAGALHPVQQAMVDCHGSQCGFCTPGIVMSLFAMRQDNGVYSRDAACDVLAGNLCRCTGYRPILEAAKKSCRAGPDKADLARTAATARALGRLVRRRTLALEAAGRRWFAPVGSGDLADILKRWPAATILAGGTDVGLWVTKEHRDLETIVHTAGVAEMLLLRRTRSHLEIGAAVTWTDAAGAIAGLWPDFDELVRRLGSVQIRNSGTLGGNVANGSPIGDSMPALIALGASLILRRGGRRRELPLDRFYPGFRQTALRPGEFLETVRIPLGSPDRLFRAWKISKRFDQDISAVCGAFALDIARGRIARARVAFGGMAATPARATTCERALTGRPFSAETLEAAALALAGDFAPIDDMRASGAYRARVAGNMLRRIWLEQAGTTSGDVARYGRPAA